MQTVHWFATETTVKQSHGIYCSNWSHSVQFQELFEGYATHIALWKIQSFIRLHNLYTHTHWEQVYNHKTISAPPIIAGSNSVNVKSLNWAFYPQTIHVSQIANRMPNHLKACASLYIWEWMRWALVSWCPYILPWLNEWLGFIVTNIHHMLFSTSSTSLWQE